MKARQFLSICGLALLLGIGGISSGVMAGEREVKPSQGGELGATSVDAQLAASESLGSATGVDVWKLSCTATTSTCAKAQVTDGGPYNDTQFSACVVGVNGGLAGKARCNISSQGGTSPLVSLCKSSTAKGPFTAYVVISEANQPGYENYGLSLICTNSSGGTVGHSVTLTQDQ